MSGPAGQMISCTHDFRCRVPQGAAPLLAPAADFAISGATTNGLIGTHDSLLAAAVRDTTGQYTLAWFGGAGLCLVAASASARIRGGQRVRRGAGLVNGGLDTLELHVFPPRASHDIVCNCETYAKP